MLKELILGFVILILLILFYIKIRKLISVDVDECGITTSGSVIKRDDE